MHNRFERVNNVEDIEHPLIRECMKLHDIHEIRLTYEGDLPARTGLGTSSTFAVGMLNAFCALKGKMMSHRQLAEEAIHVERDILQEHGGWQARNPWKLDFAYNLSFVALNVVKVMMKEIGMDYSMASFKMLMFNTYLTNRIF